MFSVFLRHAKSITSIMSVFLLTSITFAVLRVLIVVVLGPKELYTHLERRCFISRIEW
jgi:hypothetical protein